MLRVSGRIFNSLEWNARPWITPLKNIPFDDLFFYQGNPFIHRGFSANGLSVVSPFDNEYKFYGMDIFVNVVYYSVEKPKVIDWNIPSKVDETMIDYCPF